MKNPDIDTCKDCTWCCEHTVIPLIPNQSIVDFHRNWGNEVIIDSMGSPWSIIQNKCDKLDDENRCKIYEDRPIACRNFPNNWDDIYAPHCNTMRTKFKQEK